jgi:hypothetical protein
MAENSQITCDGCGNDLSVTSNCEDYRLALVNQRVPPASSSVTAMGACPALDKAAHFCGVNCLRIWMDKRYPAGGTYADAKCWAGYQRRQRAEGKPRQWL